MNYPIGPITTPCPEGGSCEISWDAISQWAAQLDAAATEMRVPETRAASHIVIESRGKRTALQVNRQYGNTYGLMQVNAGIHQALIERLAGRKFRSADEAGQALIDAPSLALRAGCAVLRSAFDQHGSWDKASSAFFLGNPEWRGADTVNGNTGARYRAALNGLIAELEAADVPETTPAPTLDPWRPYPYPKMVDLLVTKPQEGQGFDRVAPRRDKIRGFCTHITDGVGSIEGIRDLFSTGGERAYDALTDLVFGRDGRIGLLNDWRNPDRGGRRAGWANGGVDGLEGEGIAFYRAYPDINVRLVSCEHIARAGEAWTDAEIAASIEIRTAVAQELRCPWDTYPFHPGFGGISIEQQHRNFATKSCPANPYINTYDPVIRREVKAKLKAHQGGITTPVPAPVEPATFMVYGMREEQLRYLFGTMTRVNDDGSTDELPFSPTGPLSLLWMQRCEREGIFPEAEELRAWDSKLAAGREWFATWEGGWVAWLPIDNQRAGWQWLQPTPAAKAA